MKKQKSSKKIVHKTNAMRILDKFKLQYECISYSDISAVSGRSVADALLENPNQVFKTLVYDPCYQTSEFKVSGEDSR